MIIDHRWALKTPDNQYLQLIFGMCDTIEHVKIVPTLEKATLLTEDNKIDWNDLATDTGTKWIKLSMSIEISEE